MLFLGSFDCHSIFLSLHYQKNQRKNCVQGPEVASGVSGKVLAATGGDLAGAVKEPLTRKHLCLCMPLKPAGCHWSLISLT